MGEIRNHIATDHHKNKELHYYRLYAQLFEDLRFSSLHLESIVLYSMLLSRLSLSEKNNWRDEKGRIFVYCTVDETCHFLRCRRDKAMKTLRELEKYGLIIRTKQGRGRPVKIYVALLQEVDKTDL